MSISTIAFILIAVFGLGLLMLILGGLLVRSDIHRATLLSNGAPYSPSRVLDDLRPIQDLVADFVAESNPSSQLLDFLAEQTKPLSIIELRANLPFPAERLWTAVFITSVAGLIRFGRDGMAITDAGRAVRSRLNDRTVAQTESAAPVQPEQPATIGAMAPVATSSELDTARVRVEIGKLRKLTTVARDSLENGRKPARSGAAPPVSISASDHQELSAAIAAARKLAVLTSETRPLQNKLMRATIARASDIPHDLITMNSRAELVDLDTKERVDLGLVYPADANIGQNRISVFHPLGAAMLGHRVGDEFEWGVPYGARRFRVAAVRFQPEATFARAA